MTNDGHKQKSTRMASPDALALPHVIETIATCLSNQEDFTSFLHAVPRSLWTPALTAFLDCSSTTSPSVIANWPRIELRTMDLPPLLLALLAATLPLRPRIELQFAVRDAASLASLVAVVGPALNIVTLQFHRGCMVRGGGRMISSLFLQRCPRLRHVAIAVDPYTENEAVEVNDLLTVVAHPHVHESSLSLFNLQRATTVPRLGHLLASWLSTAPATKLRLANVAQMDHDGVIAFCKALQANTTLQELAISHVRSLGGFHGRTLPVSLKTLTWNVRLNGAVDDATMTDLATAVGRTQLERLECSVFGQLATCPASASMLSQLQCLSVSWSHADHMPAMIAGLSSVPALTSLTARHCSLSTSMELFMRTLATTCVHLESLSVGDKDLTRDGAIAVLSGVLQLPHLTTLSLWMPPRCALHVLPELIAAGRHLRRLSLMAIGRDNYKMEKRAIYLALALTHDVPFVVDTLPKDMDKFVVDALSPRADRCHKCDLDF
ncbi:hypothetical protein SPRG_04318 [Saprolegnia parasitica CBS 223.65]|uniref:F-box domain-containing protein n=1 Tax=Saprolegnia parasitica (strain CBS 223.65) TaxID=695850 RepID=A0A067CI31_SAPPC|nr:hypothetical protein SPRG_04318 [Saprolegnia parasitica CBS 223.65]KDO30404.1 hypothetical protein SPRG_04318 [Saprolegnia parasitica CBS 223.65]|eukprot:XP_012198639.1 hypothetical protein SPRG_04318 [Saprolegnia parasitica CBS 223.65]